MGCGNQPRVGRGVAVVDADLIAGASERLGLIASFGAGVDHIDLGAARAKKIIVTNTPSVFTDDTADLTMALIIGVPRRLRAGDAIGGRASFNRGTEFALLLTLPAAVALVVMALPLTTVLYQRGAFGAEDAAMTELALAIYGAGLEALAWCLVLAVAGQVQDAPGVAVQALDDLVGAAVDAVLHLPAVLAQQAGDLEGLVLGAG